MLNNHHPYKVLTNFVLYLCRGDFNQKMNLLNQLDFGNKTNILPKSNYLFL